MFSGFVIVFFFFCAFVVDLYWQLCLRVVLVESFYIFVSGLDLDLLFREWLSKNECVNTDFVVVFVFVFFFGILS